LANLAAALIRFHKRYGARPEVVRNKEIVAGRDPAFRARYGLQIRNLCRGIEVDLQLREVTDLSAPPARSKLKFTRLIHEAALKRLFWSGHVSL
jgi:hypothetical protein